MQCPYRCHSNGGKTYRYCYNRMMLCYNYDEIINKVYDYDTSNTYMMFLDGKYYIEKNLELLNFIYDIELKPLQVRIFHYHISGKLTPIAYSFTDIALQNVCRKSYTGNISKKMLFDIKKLKL